MPRRSLALLALGLAAMLGCATPRHFTDYTSVSVGRTNAGRIHRPAKMPTRGPGFEIPKTWRDRGNNFGTDELVALIERAAAVVRAQRKVTLGVADLSALRGGDTPWHSSHHSGRDVDLIFYSVDERGKSLPPPQVEMVAFDGEGNPFVPKSLAKTGYTEPTWQQRRFDTARNWALVEALLSDPAVRVQWIFVSTPLENRLLQWAKRQDRPAWLIEYARQVMKQPSLAAPHDDHFHVRIYCSRADRERGCEDTGPIWAHEKKTYKYGGPERYDPALTDAFLARPFFFVHG
jgi:penicillin-insensitive murein endopeptidase